MTMVGRAGELRGLRAAWSTVAEAGEPGTVCPAVVTGEPGTGKSLLVASALAALTPAPGVVLSGTARVHSPAPYDWLASVLSGHEPTAELAATVPSDALAWLAQHPDAPRTRYAPDGLLRMAVRVVRGLVGTGPAVVVVEDLHALDPASLNLVGELVTAPRLSALLIVTSRLPGTESSLVARTLARLSGAPAAVRLHLGPLTADEAAELLAAAYPSRSVERSIVDVAVARTGGNPYRLRELLARSRDPADIAAALPAAEPTGPTEPVEPAELTAREAEVLSCIATGMSNKQIARALGISIRTVTVHVSNLLRKTRSTSRTEAALWAVRRQPAARV